MGLFSTGLVCAAALLLFFYLYRRPSRVPVRFGHAFPNPVAVSSPAPVQEAHDILIGSIDLTSRSPSDPATVSRAEALLKIDPRRRPVYAYIGCLHPAFGSVGLIIGRRWFEKSPHGVSCCDTGGLAAQKGGFKYLTLDQAMEAVRRLSYLASSDWEDKLAREIKQAFAEWTEYLQGATPKTEKFDQFRRHCIDSTVRDGGELDRRLWTWEVRGFSPVTAEDIEVVVFQHEATKEFARLCRIKSPPAHVRILFGVPPTPGTGGLHYFAQSQVIEAFGRAVP